MDWCWLDLLVRTPHIHPHGRYPTVTGTLRITARRRVAGSSMRGEALDDEEHELLPPSSLAPL
jgi:hypothetical protein